MTFNGTEAPRQLQHNRDQVKYWRYVVETWHGKTYLGIFKVKPNENGETVMTDLHHAIQRLKTGKAFGNLDRTLPFWVPVVEDGVLSSYDRPRVTARHMSSLRDRPQAKRRAHSCFP
ncbi:hypothetical protein GLAREA_01025 [Glarea lozoyensis ATCC 20868]|uniref:Uncharacterized protein n=1 Tax=Glarea lozoyensis (strain ATCC 20868 / MF5171) TaxID=1116229 RepID=S3CW71_GLAL2|nr:uncharacterized protein GLAREA_01025 [Glarea lozoyensis ATCC 20868]EPE29865.1 hypothetical protein GLAREA_01025 [Glarea lozoyensis ATCC 20868]